MTWFLSTQHIQLYLAKIGTMLHLSITLHSMAQTSRLRKLTLSPLHFTVLLVIPDGRGLLAPSLRTENTLMSTYLLAIEEA